MSERVSGVPTDEAQGATFLTLSIGSLSATEDVAAAESSGPTDEECARSGVMAVPMRDGEAFRAGGEPGSLGEMKPGARSVSGRVRGAIVAALRTSARERLASDAEAERLRELVASLHREGVERDRQLAARQRVEEELRRALCRQADEIARLSEALEERRRDLELTVENSAALVRKLTAEVEHLRRGRDAEARRAEDLIGSLRRDREAERQAWLEQVEAGGLGSEAEPA